MGQYAQIIDAVEGAAKDIIMGNYAPADKIGKHMSELSARRDYLKLIYKKLRSTGIADEGDYFPAEWPSKIKGKTFYWLIDELEGLLCD